MSLDIALIETSWVSYDEGKSWETEETTVYETNWTHNLSAMAKAAEIFDILWNPRENDIKKCSEIIEPLQIGLERLKMNKKEFSKYNAANGWGTYDQFIPMLEEYLEECRKHPNALIQVWK